MELNKEQQQAVNHFKGVCITTAIPGSGKTMALTARAVKFIREHHVAPQNILCLTFTNKAANEMRERVAKEIGIQAEPVWISTFHAFCVAVLRKYGKFVGLTSDFSIYADNDQKELIRKVARMHDYECKANSSELWRMKKAADNFREDIEDFESALTYLRPIEKDILQAYLKTLDEFNATDFSGILYKTWLLMKKEPRAAEVLHKRFKYVLIDEMQDTNTIQYEIVKKVVDPTDSRTGNMFVVGDFNQSIFAFRGAKPENIGRVGQDFDNVTEIVLHRNYRSTSRILEAAQKLIRNNENATTVTLTSHRGDGNDIAISPHMNPDEEAYKIAQAIEALRLKNKYKYSDFAILYRTNVLSKPVELAMRNAGIPYKIVGGFSFFDRSEIKSVFAYLSFLSNANDTIAFERAISYPSRKVGEKAIGKLEKLCKEEGITMLEACRKSGSVDGILKAGVANLNKFADITEKYQGQLKQGKSLGEVAGGFLLDTGYYNHMKEEGKKDPDTAKRVDNIDALLADIADYSVRKPNATLSDYLHIQSLLSGLDEADEDSVMLLTCHTSKGLEWECVFIVGVEENIVPHVLSVKEGRIEEERRLLYVSATRSCSYLFINYCTSRSRYNFRTKTNTWQSCQPSRFIDEIE